MSKEEARKPASETIMMGLVDSDHLVQAHAVSMSTALRESDDQAMKELASRQDWRIRAVALRAIGKKRFPRLRPFVVARTRDPHPAVRIAAIRAATERGYSEICPLLITQPGPTSKALRLEIQRARRKLACKAK